VFDEAILSSFFSTLMRIALERSSANWRRAEWRPTVSSLWTTTGFVVLARQYSFVIRKLSGQLARGQDAAADAEEQSRFVPGKLDGLNIGALSSELSSAIAFLGTSIFISPLTPGFEVTCSTWASRWPSVATMVMLSAFKTSSAPFSV